MAMAALSNAVLSLVMPLYALWLIACRKISRKSALGLLVVPLLLLGAWHARGALLPPATSSVSRALINLDQGSWPGYHAAYQGTFRHDPESTDKLRAIDRETATLLSDPAQGLQLILARMGDAPFRYAAWYASKPWLLWGWDIRMGQGDIYVYPTRASPFVENAGFRAVAALCRALNPFLPGVMAISWFVIVVRRRQAPPSLHLAGLLTAYVTLVYTVLQAEPRYSIPFRPLEILLATWGTWLVCQAAMRRRATASHPT
jgi:hypothetical protein